MSGICAAIAAVRWALAGALVLLLLGVGGCLTVPDEIRREFVPQINPARLPVETSDAPQDNAPCAIEAAPLPAALPDATATEAPATDGQGIDAR